MTIKEFYDEISGNYQETLGRIMKEERIQKYLVKFAQNTDYDSFVSSLNEKNYEDAFRFVHNIKGMSLNLGLTRLGEISSVVCDELRSGVPTGNIKEDVAVLGDVYNKTLSAIKSAFDC